MTYNQRGFVGIGTLVFWSIYISIAGWMGTTYVKALKHPEVTYYHHCYLEGDILMCKKSGVKTYFKVEKINKD